MGIRNIVDSSLQKLLLSYSRSIKLAGLLGVSLLLFGCLNQSALESNNATSSPNYTYNNSQSRQPPYIDQVVLSAFNSSEWVQVIVNLDYTNNTTLDNERLTGILNSLQSSEFRLRFRGTRGDWFSGNLSRSGFEKLRIMPFVSDIYPNRPAYAGENN